MTNSEVSSERRISVQMLVEKVESVLDHEVASRVETALQDLREALHGAVDAWYEDQLHRQRQALSQRGEQAPSPPTSYPEEVMNMQIADLGFDTRIRKCLIGKLGIKTVGELVQQTPDRLLEVKHFGVIALRVVRNKLNELHVKLKDDWEV